MELLMQNGPAVFWAAAGLIAFVNLVIMTRYQIKSHPKDSFSSNFASVLFAFVIIYVISMVLAWFVNLLSYGSIAGYQPQAAVLIFLVITVVLPALNKFFGRGKPAKQIDA